MLHSPSDPPEDTRAWGVKAPKGLKGGVVELQIEVEKIFSLTFCSNLRRVRLDLHSTF